MKRKHSLSKSTPSAKAAKSSLITSFYHKKGGMATSLSSVCQDQSLARVCLSPEGAGANEGENTGKSGASSHSESDADSELELQRSSDLDPGATVLSSDSNLFVNDSESDSDHEHNQEADESRQEEKGDDAEIEEILESDLSSHSGDAPAQPSLASFPQTKLGSKKRSFCASWYKAFPWIEYSVNDDAAYCFPCRPFQIGAGTRKMNEAFVSKGFRNWKKATGKKGYFVNHSMSQNHKAAMSLWQDKKASMSKKGTFGVDMQLIDMGKDDIQRNKHYLRAIIETVLTLARQNIPLRGHDETSESLNRGNFLAIFELLVSRDSELKRKMDNLPRNATYLSPKMQNTILHLLATMLKEQIQSEISAAGAFTLMCDETRDTSKQEQLAIVLRFVYTKKVFERFLEFVTLQDLSAAGIAQTIVGSLSRSKITITDCVWQSYDGASVMSGHRGGVQKKIRESCPRAIFSHCHAHRLNLVLVNCCKADTWIQEFFIVLQNLYVFVSSSAVFCVFQKVQSEMKRENASYNPVTLKRLSDTRWTCRIDSVQAVRKGFPAIVETLIDVGDNDQNRDRSITARGLLLQVRQTKFVVCLFVYEKVFLITKGLSDALQSKDLDLAAAVELMQTIVKTLEGYRREATPWNTLWSNICSCSEQNDIDIKIPAQSCRKKKQSTRLADFVVGESLGSREVDSGQMSASSYFRCTVFNAFLDRIIEELKTRFSDESTQIFVALTACNPHSESFLNVSVMEPLLRQYDINQAVLSAQAECAKNYLIGKDFNSLGEALKHLIPLKEAFSELVRLWEIVLTMGVSTASCERAFSCLKRLKTYLRASMTQDRLNDMAVLAIESDLAKNLDIDKTVKTFIEVDFSRKLKFM